MCLASLVYHAGWMKENFPETHFIRTTSLFSPGIAENLKDIVRVHIPNGNDSFAITGIPPHISILTQMHGMMERVDHVVPQIESVDPEVVQGLTMCWKSEQLALALSLHMV
jgi:hypothetical protein